MGFSKSASFTSDSVFVILQIWAENINDWEERFKLCQKQKLKSYRANFEHNSMLAMLRVFYYHKCWYHLCWFYWQLLVESLHYRLFWKDSRDIDFLLNLREKNIDLKIVARVLQQGFSGGSHVIPWWDAALGISSWGSNESSEWDLHEFKQKWDKTML